jgi:hypothetical protein
MNSVRMLTLIALCACRSTPTRSPQPADTVDVVADDTAAPPPPPMVLLDHS